MAAEENLGQPFGDDFFFLGGSSLFFWLLFLKLSCILCFPVVFFVVFLVFA